MDPKRLLMLLGILIVLVGAAVLSGAFKRNERTISVPKFDVPGDELTALSVVLPDDSLALSKSGTRWMLTGPVAHLSDSFTVARFMEELSGAEIEAIASHSPDRWAHYGVDESGIVVVASWKGGSRTFVVGNQGPDYRSTYVRLEGDDRVFVTNGRLAPAKELDRWRDKKVLDLAAGDLASVSVRRPEGTYYLQRGPTGWTLDGEAADSSSVAAFLRRFGPVRADGFHDELPPVILEESSYELALTTTSGTTELVRVIEYEDALALATGTGEFTYRLLSSRLDSYFPDPETLK